MTTRGIKGPGEGSEAPDPKKSKKAVDAEAFKEMMEVGKVREVDPEEKRKRKQKQEAEMEASAAQVQAAPLAPLQPQATGQDDSSFKINLTALGAGVPSSPEEFSEEDLDTATEGSLYFVNSEEEPPTPPPQPQMTPESQVAPPQPFIPSETFLPEEDEMQLSTPDQPQSQQAQQPATETPKVSPTKKKKSSGKQQISAPKSVPKKATLPIKAASPQKLEKPVPPTKKETFTERLIKAAPGKEEIEQVAEAENAPATPLPQGSWEKMKAKKEDKISEAAQTESEQNAPQIPIPIPNVIPPEITPATPYASLHPQVWDLFERMVGVMTIMNGSGITETTINLTGDQFKASPFFGTQITIREFTTAPKNYNIEMLIPSQVTKTVERNYNDLVAAFQAGNYNFKVNRLEWRELPAEEAKKRKVVKAKKKREEE